MRRTLYSELRTLYETTAADPHTFRLTIKLKDLVDGEVLRGAVDSTMARYPYFRVRLGTADGEPCFEENICVGPCLHPRNKSHLVMLKDPFNVLSNFANILLRSFETMFTKDTGQ